MTPELEQFLESFPDWKNCPDLVVNPPFRTELAERYPELDDDLLDVHDEVISPGVTRGAVYYKMRLAGESHRMSEMVALQRSIGLNTDDVFFSGSKPLYDQFGSQKHLDRYLASAKRQGFTPPVNATYFPNLARFPGDKEAWVTRAMGRSYIKKLCEKRGWACEGGINVEAREPDSDPLAPENCKPLGEDLIQARAKQMMLKDQSIRRMKRSELREKIIAQHGPTT